MTPIIHSDAELLQLMLAGDEHSFGVLYRRHQGAVYRFALLMSGAPNIAEEVTQEVFLTLIRQPERYQASRGSLPSYLCGVARNHILRILSREQSFVPLDDELEHGIEAAKFIATNNPHDECARKEVIRLVRQIVLALPIRYREVVVLCDFQEMSYAEVASVLGAPVGTVNSRLHRAHALMLEKLRSVSKLDSTISDVEWMRGMKCFA